MQDLKANIENFSEELSKVEQKDNSLISTFGGIALHKKGIVFEVNEQFSNIFGYSKNEIVGIYVKDLLTLESYNLAIKNIIFGHERIYILDCIKKDRSTIKCRVCSKLINSGGKTLGILAVRDITDEISFKDEDEIKYNKYTSLFENSLDGIYMATFEKNFIDVNPALIKILGYSNKNEILSIAVPSQLIFLKKDELYPHYKKSAFFETRLERKDGQLISVEVNSSVIYEKTRPAYMQGIIRDITQRKKSEEKIKFLGFHDYLTTLYNRAFFEEELKRLNTERQLPLSIIIADINGLKIVNDTFGHKEGDNLLCNFAKIMKSCCRQEDILARWGGDEFVVILPKTLEKNAKETTDRIKQACRNTDNNKIVISVSLGFATRKTVDQNIHRVIKEAEDIMYTNKLIDTESTSNSIFASLKKILYEKSIETENHANRLKETALLLGNTIGLSDRKLDELVLLGSLHDIGKVAVPEQILKKKEKLTWKEWNIIKKHPETGYRIVLSSSQLAPISKGILHHHERWDGKGYPQGLQGEDIPITSRIISVVDAYDVMRNGRPYKKALSKKESIRELKRGAGTQFDPFLIEKFINILKSLNNHK